MKANRLKKVSRLICRNFLPKINVSELDWTDTVHLAINKSKLGKYSAPEVSFLLKIQILARAFMPVYTIYRISCLTEMKYGTALQVMIRNLLTIMAMCVSFCLFN